MRDFLYDQLASVEDRLWWHASRTALVRLFLGRVSLPDEAAALDVGCGTGGAFDLLSAYATKVVGVDESPRALQHARQKHPAADVRRIDANALSDHFQDATFDLVTLFNVLYHEWITDDAAVLEQVWRMLKPGGTILVTESAFRCLARRHDKVDMGRRRYRLAGMRGLLERQQFEWVAGSYFNAISFLPAWLLARWERVAPRDTTPDAPLAELSLPPRPINGMMKWAMACERTVIRLFGRIPFGVSLIAVGRKSDKTCVFRSPTRSSVSGACQAVSPFFQGDNAGFDTKLPFATADNLS